MRSVEIENRAPPRNTTDGPYSPTELVFRSIVVLFLFFSFFFRWFRRDPTVQWAGLSSQERRGPTEEINYSPSGGEYECAVPRLRHV